MPQIISAKKDLLATGLPYTSSMESTAPLQAWFEQRGSVIESKIAGAKGTFSTRKVLLDDLEKPCVTLGLAINVADSDFWKDISPPAPGSDCPDIDKEADNFSKLAQNLQKNQTLCALAVAVDTQRLFTECRKYDTSVAAQVAQYYAGLVYSTPVHRIQWVTGVTAVHVSTVSPLADTVERLCPALLAGHRVVLCAPAQVCRTVAILTELLHSSGFDRVDLVALPPRSLPESSSAEQPDVSLLVPEFIQRTIRYSPQSAIPLSSRQSTPLSVIIVTDSADLGSAVQSVIDAMTYSSGRSPVCPQRAFVQESVYKKFSKMLVARAKNVRTGNNLDKSVDAPVVVGARTDTLKQLLDGCQAEGAECIGLGNSTDKTGSSSGFIAVGLAPASPILEHTFAVPFLAVMPFRTLKEAATLCNNLVVGSLGIWAESVTAGMELARSVKVCDIWINSYNTASLAVGSQGSFGSGWSVTGKSAVLDYVVLRESSASEARGVARDDDTDGSESGTAKEYKIYYGGAKKYPDSGSFVAFPGAKSQVKIPVGNQKDVVSAVNSALSASASWMKSSSSTRSDMFLRIARSLKAKTGDLVSSWRSLGRNKVDADSEVGGAVEFLRYLAFCSFHTGSYVQPDSGTSVLCSLEPCGVIGMVLPDRLSLLDAVGLLGAALAFGNCVVAVCGTSSAAAPLGFCEVLEAAGVPSGIINVVSGDTSKLAETFGLFNEINTIWLFDDQGSKISDWERIALSVGKRLWRQPANIIDWSIGRREFWFEMLRHFSVQHKRIWIPTGQSFAN